MSSIPGPISGMQAAAEVGCWIKVTYGDYLEAKAERQQNRREMQMLIGAACLAGQDPQSGADVLQLQMLGSPDGAGT